MKVNKKGDFLSTLPSTKAILAILIATHLLPVLFVIYTENFLNQFLPSLFVILIPLFFILYKSIPAESSVPTFKSSMKIIGIAVSALMTLFMVSYCSLIFQLPIKTDHDIVWVILPGAQSMAYVLRLFLQTWIFALVCMMAARWLTHSPEFSGFLSRFFPKKEWLPWIMDMAASAGILLVLSIILMFACQQLFYVSSRLFGFNDLFAFPQLNILIFLFSVFMLNKASSFSKRILNYAKQPSSKLGLVYLAFILFLCSVWMFSQFAILGLPKSVQMELAQALNNNVASLALMKKNWPILILSCSFLMVVPISVLLSRLLSSGFLLSVGISFPILITAFFLLAFPSINAVFWSWSPALNFSTVPVTDKIVSFQFNGFSIILLLLTAFFLCMMSKNSIFMRSMLEIAPDNWGRRTHRIKFRMSQFFQLLCFVFAIFSILGVYGLAMNTAVYMPTVLTACLILIGLGIYQRFRMEKI